MIFEGIKQQPHALLRVFQKLLIFCDIEPHEPSFRFTKNGARKRKYPAGYNCVDENAMLMSEVKGKWVDFSFDIQVESIYPSNFAFTAQAAAAAGGVVVWAMVSWHTLGSLAPFKHRLNTTSYLSRGWCQYGYLCLLFFRISSSLITKSAFYLVKCVAVLIISMKKLGRLFSKCNEVHI